MDIGQGRTTCEQKIDGAITAMSSKSEEQYIFVSRKLNQPICQSLITKNF